VSKNSWCVGELGLRLISTASLADKDLEELVESLARDPIESSSSYERSTLNDSFDVSSAAVRLQAGGFRRDRLEPCWEQQSESGGERPAISEEELWESSL
jgi:hypothetical protein